MLERDPPRAERSLQSLALGLCLGVVPLQLRHVGRHLASATTAVHQPQSDNSKLVFPLQRQRRVLPLSRQQRGQVRSRYVAIVNFVQEDFKQKEHLPLFLPQPWALTVAPATVKRDPQVSWLGPRSKNRGMEEREYFSGYSN